MNAIISKGKCEDLIGKCGPAERKECCERSQSFRCDVQTYSKTYRKNNKDNGISPAKTNLRHGRNIWKNNCKIFGTYIC